MTFLVNDIFSLRSSGELDNRHTVGSDATSEGDSQGGCLHVRDEAEGSLRSSLRVSGCCKG
jgi:hypothetical protein